jgi:hypothetical protein
MEVLTELFHWQEHVQANLSGIFIKDDACNNGPDMSNLGHK